jgi:FkbM family methyltransferase
MPSRPKAAGAQTFAVLTNRRAGVSTSNPLEDPNFVGASTVEDVGGGLKLFTFPNGFRCYSHSNDNETTLIYNEIFVQQEYLGTNLSLDDCHYVFDVGANIGLFTIFAKMRNRDLVVHAFEPIKATYDVLVKNIALHGLTHVYPHNYALGSQDGTERTMTFYPNAAGIATAHPETNEELKRTLTEILGQELTNDMFQSPEAQAVHVRTLSAVIDQVGVPVIDLLKIDTESDEREVLHGIVDTHYPIIRQITGEMHSAALLAECQQLLVSKGFHVFSEAGIAASGNTMYAVRK